VKVNWIEGGETKGVTKILRYWLFVGMLDKLEGTCAANTSMWCSQCFTKGADKSLAL
jgi:hypothetical protein